MAILVSSGTARVRLSSGKKNSMHEIIPINEMGAREEMCEEDYNFIRVDV